MLQRGLSALSKSHFENPLVEQRELVAGVALARIELGVIEIVGDARLGWLHSLLSQNLANLKPGDSAETLLLDPHGHVEQQIRVLNKEASTLLVVEPERTEALLAWLKKMVFRTAVTLTDRSQEFEALVGFAEQPALAEYAQWQDRWPGPTPGGFRYSAREVSYGLRLWLVPKGTELPANAKPAGTMALEALRIAAGRPAASDFDDKSLPHEFDLLTTAVHLSKGCYRGQETVAKVHNLGRPPRRLTLLHLDSSEALPPAGAVVLSEGKECGRVLAAAVHFESGAIALALIARRVDEALPLTIEFEGSTVAANQEVLVPAEAGRVAPPPKLPRLNLRGS
jgi:tRNA-modifying protein YgfZ